MSMGEEWKECESCGESHWQLPCSSTDEIEMTQEQRDNARHNALELRYVLLLQELDRVQGRIKHLAQCLEKDDITES